MAESIQINIDLFLLCSSLNGSIVDQDSGNSHESARRLVVIRVIEVNFLFGGGRGCKRSQYIWSFKYGPSTEVEQIFIVCHAQHATRVSLNYLKLEV